MDGEKELRDWVVKGADVSPPSLSCQIMEEIMDLYEGQSCWWSGPGTVPLVFRVTSRMKRKRPR